MYESVSVLGERGQITIPKDIRDREGLKPKDKVIVKIEDEKIVVEKLVSKKERERLLKEYYAKYSALESDIEDEMKYASQEADAVLDDY